MLVRVRGGREGVAEYLRHGLKAGREFTRDQLDERITLAGDLELTDSIVQGMTNRGNRYLHVTLSFKEDHIAPETLRAITEEFRAFTCAAYADDEFNFYAEAHLPRIKTILNQATGKEEIRVPHIHVVIPQKNLLSGEYLNPFGIGDRSNEFIKAFQERINAQYGLSSPDDNPRDSFNNESAMLSRYKGDQFQGAHRALKEKIRDDVIALGIDSREAFRDYLAQRWDTSTVNAKGRECFAIRPEAGSRRVRLTESFFATANIEKPTAVKLEQQRMDAMTYVEQTAPRKALEAHSKKEAQWHEFRAKEIKYLNSGRRGEWQRYKAADPDARAALLAGKEQSHYTKHRQEPFNAEFDRHRQHVAANLRAASRHLDAAGRVDRDAKRARRKLDDRRVARTVGAIVERRGRDQGTAGQDPAVGEPTPHRVDSVAGSLLAHVDSARHERSAAQRPEMAEIKQNLSGERLLAHLSHTHGVLPERYQVERTNAGDRIRCGTRSYNVTDFCTKEMNMRFADAAPLLRDCYADQQRKLDVQAKPARPREVLWQDYTQRWRTERRDERASAALAMREAERQERRALTEKYRKERASLSADRSVAPAEKKAMRSVIRVRQIEEQQTLKKRTEQLRKEFAETHPVRPTFNDYLQDMAGQGNAAALSELRRQSRPTRDAEHAVRVTSTAAATEIPFQPLDYRVSRNGDVTYYDQAGDVMRDGSKAVSALRADDAAVATALRVAQAKFCQPGQKTATEVSLAGSDAQIQRAIEVAAREGIAVRFSDSRHEAMRRDLQDKYRAGRELIERQRQKNQGMEPKSRQEHARKDPARAPANERDPTGRGDRGMGR